MNTRFPMNATTVAEASEYLHNRAIQILADGYKLTSIAPQNHWGVRAMFEHQGKVFQAVYVLAQHRGKGYLRKHAEDTKIPFVTSPDCQIEDYFLRNYIPCQLAGLMQGRKEYRAVSEFYGYRCAKRSGVPYMNHIDEGHAILEWIGASTNAKLAYFLHPLFQEDSDLATNFERIKDVTDNYQVLALALEYRNIANAYLSPRSINNIDEIKLGPLSEVRDMLIADKVQNYKDFLTYHAETHPRRKELDEYFRNWLAKLNIPTSLFEDWRRSLNVERFH